MDLDPPYLGEVFRHAPLVRFSSWELAVPQKYLALRNATEVYWHDSSLLEILNVVVAEVTENQHVEEVDEHQW